MCFDRHLLKSTVVFFFLDNVQGLSFRFIWCIVPGSLTALQGAAKNCLPTWISQYPDLSVRWYSSRLGVSLGRGSDGRGFHLGNPYHVSRAGLHQPHPLLTDFSVSDQFISVTQSRPTLFDSMDYSTPGLPVHHQLPELTQTHVHRVSDVIQPSHPLSSPSPPAFNLSQHQGLF